MVIPPQFDDMVWFILPPHCVKHNQKQGGCWVLISLLRHCPEIPEIMET